MNIPIIRGKSVDLALAKLDDRQRIYDWCFRSETTKAHFGPPTFPNLATPTFEEFYTEYADYFFTGDAPEKGLGFLIMRHGEAVGFVSCCAFHLKPHKSELDIWLSSEASCGKGYGTDALVALSDYLARERGIREFIMRPSFKNPRAISSYKKAGFAESNAAPSDYLLDEYVAVYGGGDYGEGESATMIKRIDHT